jgi:hypothetical protein
MLSCRKWLTHKISDRLTYVAGPSIEASPDKKPTLENAERRRRGEKKIRPWC